MIFRLALLVFFASGFAALLYQVIWQRLLAMFSGADVYSATVIVAAFMAGLGVGHLAGGHVADRVSRRTSLVLFGAAELAIGVFGAFSAALYYGVLYQRVGQFDLSRESMATILFFSLLWPTFFMGASLPLLARAVTDTIERAASAVGALYGFNTLGAACGATVATWVLLPELGLAGSLRVGAVLNVACAAVLVPAALRLDRTGRVLPDPAGRRDAGVASADRRVHEAPPSLATSRLSRHVTFWALTYGFAGFVALSYEIVWFRLLGVMAKSTAFTFGTLLTLYLAGIGLGAVAGSAFAARARRPRRRFFVLQAAAGLSAPLLLTIFVGVADDIRALRGYFDAYEPLSVRDSIHALRILVMNLWPGPDAPGGVPANFLRLYVLVPLILVVPPTFLMGCAFPFLQRVVQTDVARVGRRVGVLLLANVVGSMLGTVLTGWVLLGALGTAGTLKLLAVMSGMFLLCAVLAACHEGDQDDVAGINTKTSDYEAEASQSQTTVATVVPVAASSSSRALWLSRRPVLGTAAAGAGVLLLLAAMPDAARLWARLHGTTADRLLFAEDNSGLSVIKATENAFTGSKIVFVNGVGQSVLPYGGIHTALGALPAIVHPDPREVAIIGLGSGDTVYAAASRPETERVTCIEIIRPQLATLQALSLRDSYGGLHALLRDPRVEHVFGDGRAYLMRTRRRFDIIEADALRPTSAYSGHLYSDAYFTLVRDRLKPHGLAATWAPTRRIHDTFVRVFPYVVSVPGILLGSREPFDLDRRALAARLADPRLRDHYQRAGIDIESLIRPYVEGEAARFGPDFNRATLVDVNTDLFPKDEYDLTPPDP